MSDRLPDWEPRLAEYLADAGPRVAAGEPMLCALFAAGAVEAVTGENPADAFRGRYRDVADDLEATIDGLFPPRPVALAQRGDLAWVGGCVGVVTGGEAHFVGEDETGVPTLLAAPRSTWAKAWGVGHG